MQDILQASPFLSPPPKVILVNGFGEPYDNAVATARTCYNSRIITSADVRKDEKARVLRDRIAQETYFAGHHTTIQHATFQFTIENVSRQALWSFLHSHPFYNSEQVSQRYVEVRPGNVILPRLPEPQVAIYRAAVEAMMSAYRALIELLTPMVASDARDAVLIRAVDVLTDLALRGYPSQRRSTDFAKRPATHTGRRRLRMWPLLRARRYYCRLSLRSSRRVGRRCWGRPIPSMPAPRRSRVTPCRRRRTPRGLRTPISQ